MEQLFTYNATDDEYFFKALSLMNQCYLVSKRLKFLVFACDLSPSNLWFPWRNLLCTEKSGNSAISIFGPTPLGNRACMHSSSLETRVNENPLCSRSEFILRAYRPPPPGSLLSVAQSDVRFVFASHFSLYYHNSVSYFSHIDLVPFTTTIFLTTTAKKVSLWRGPLLHFGWLRRKAYWVTLVRFERFASLPCRLQTEWMEMWDRLLLNYLMRKTDVRTAQRLFYPRISIKALAATRTNLINWVKTGEYVHQSPHRHHYERHIEDSNLHEKHTDQERKVTIKKFSQLEGIFSKLSGIFKGVIHTLKINSWLQNLREVH
jgi:hypothetical protein